MIKLVIAMVTMVTLISSCGNNEAPNESETNTIMGRIRDCGNGVRGLFIAACSITDRTGYTYNRNYCARKASSAQRLEERQCPDCNVSCFTECVEHFPYITDENGFPIPVGGGGSVAIITTVSCVDGTMVN